MTTRSTAKCAGCRDPEALHIGQYTFDPAGKDLYFKQRCMAFECTCLEYRTRRLDNHEVRCERCQHYCQNHRKFGVKPGGCACCSCPQYVGLVEVD